MESQFHGKDCDVKFQTRRKKTETLPCKLNSGQKMTKLFPVQKMTKYFFSLSSFLIENDDGRN